jgi:hypothetical protein
MERTDVRYYPYRLQFELQNTGFATNRFAIP